jgi:hypothetical protein
VSQDEPPGSAEKDDQDHLDAARRALVGRREVALLDDPSVAAMACLLVARCREPAPWVRAAVGTLDRFRREVAAGDLPAMLEAGRRDAATGVRSLEQLALRHDGLTAGQLSQLAFGPRLWWTAAGVEVPWRPLATAASSRPVPGRGGGPDVRLLLLAVIGAGATERELLGVRLRDAGRLDASGRIVPDVEADPLAVAYRDGSTGAEHVTFLSFEARSEVLVALAARQGVGPDDPLLVPAERAAQASAGTAATSAALIGAGNDVNVTLCRATGDFFRTWGMPGARFDARTAAAPADRTPSATTDSEEQAT